MYVWLRNLKLLLRLCTSLFFIIQKMAYRFAIIGSRSASLDCQWTLLLN